MPVLSFSVPKVVFFLTFNHFYKFGCFSTNCSKANRRVLCLENLEFLKLEYLVLLV